MAKMRGWVEDRGFQYGHLDQQRQRAWNLAVVEALGPHLRLGSRDSGLGIRSALCVVLIPYGVSEPLS